MACKVLTDPKLTNGPDVTTLNKPRFCKYSTLNMHPSGVQTCTIEHKTS